MSGVFTSIEFTLRIELKIRRRIKVCVMVTNRIIPVMQYFWIFVSYFYPRKKVKKNLYGYLYCFVLMYIYVYDRDAAA